MRRYQEKLLNQNYSAHLENLRHIKNRKNIQEQGNISRSPPQERYLEKKKIKQQNQRLLKSIQNPKRILLSRQLNTKKDCSSQQKQRKQRLNGSLLQNKNLNVEPTINSLHKTLPIINRSTQPHGLKLNDPLNMSRMEKLKQFLSESKHEIKQIGKGSSKIVIEVKCFQIFSLNLSKQHENQILFEFYFGNQTYRSRLMKQDQIVGQDFHLRFKKFQLALRQLTIGIHQYRGISSYPLGYVQIPSKEMGSETQGKVHSGLIFKNKQEPVGLIEYQMKVQF